MNEEPKQPASIIKRERVLLAGSEPKSLVRAANAPACGRKSVRFVVHEQRPRAIEFTCACGETSLVELVFQEEAANSKSGVQS
jgi:hypothetical protein